MKTVWLCVLLSTYTCASKLLSVGEERKERYQVKEEEQELAWMLQPDGRGDPSVAVLSGYEPEVLDLDSIELKLYTRNNDKIVEKLSWNGTCRPTFTMFDSKKKTKVLIHGFGDNSEESYMYDELTAAYLQRGDYNIVEVDWSKLAGVPWYLSAATGTRAVGERLADMLSAQGIAQDRTEIVGFSLGAHVAGAAGSRLGRVGKITGLDPAQVLFTSSPPDYRLDPNDARLVEVVHTSGGYLGFLDPLGHRDYFPNGGSWPQPGCELDYVAVCSHRRAYYYYAEAIKNNGKGFEAVNCKDYKDYMTSKCKPSKDRVIPLGSEYNPKKTAKGKFFFSTNSRVPYGRELHNDEE